MQPLPPFSADLESAITSAFAIVQLAYRATLLACQRTRTDLILSLVAITVRGLHPHRLAGQCVSVAKRQIMPLTIVHAQTTLLDRRDEVSEVFHSPLLELVFAAASVHRMHNDPSMVRGTCKPTRARMLLQRWLASPAARICAQQDVLSTGCKPYQGR